MLNERVLEAKLKIFIISKREIDFTIIESLTIDMNAVDGWVNSFKLTAIECLVFYTLYYSWTL